MIRIKRKTSNLEVGAPALRQGVVLLPKGQGVPVRAIIGGFEGEVKQTVIEVDDESTSSPSPPAFSEFCALCGETQRPETEKKQKSIT